MEGGAPDPPLLPINIGIHLDASSSSFSCRLKQSLQSKHSNIAAKGLMFKRMSKAKLNWE